MCLLAVATLLDDCHDNVLRRHERKLLRDPSGNDFRVYHKALGDVLERGEDDVSGEEGFREGDPAIRAKNMALRPITVMWSTNQHTYRPMSAQTIAHSKS